MKEKKEIDHKKGLQIFIESIKDLRINGIHLDNYECRPIIFGKSWYQRDPNCIIQKKITKIYEQIPYEVRYHWPYRYQDFILFINSYQKVVVSERVKTFVDTMKLWATCKDPADQLVFKTILETSFDRFPGSKASIIKEIVRYSIESADFGPEFTSWRLYYKGNLYGMPNMEPYFSDISKFKL